MMTAVEGAGKKTIVAISITIAHDAADKEPSSQAEFKVGDKEPRRRCDHLDDHQRSFHKSQEPLSSQLATPLAEQQNNSRNWCHSNDDWQRCEGREANGGVAAAVAA